MKVILFLSLIGSLSALPTQPALPAPNRTQVINGDDLASISEAPFMVSIGANGHMCGGSLLNKRWVLTAAQCVIGLDQNLLRVRFNSNYHFKKGDIVGVDYIVIHPNFMRTNMLADIALLHLKNDTIIMYNYSEQLYLELPLPGEQPKSEWNLNLFGFGRIDPNENGQTTTGNNQLKRVTIKTVDFNQCSQYYAMHGIILMSSTHFCAGRGGESIHNNSMKGTEENMCIGDQGGALFAQFTGNHNVAYGIASFTIGCGRENYPGVYTQVSKYVDWIKNTIQSGTHSVIQ